MSDDDTKRRTGRDELTDEENADMDATLAKINSDGQATRWFLLSEDGVEHLEDPRDSEQGLLQSTVYVRTPGGLDVFGVVHNSGRPVSTQVLNGAVLVVGDGLTQKTVMTYSPTGWLNYMTGTGTIQLPIDR
jgi:hypothetical protein